MVILRITSFTKYGVKIYEQVEKILNQIKYPIILHFNPRQNSDSKDMYLIYFDQPGRFDPYWTGLTQVWPLMIPTNLSGLTLIRRFDPSLTSDDLEQVKIDINSLSVKNLKSFTVYVISIGSFGGLLEPFFDFCSFCSRAPSPDHRFESIKISKFQIKGFQIRYDSYDSHH